MAKSDIREYEDMVLKVIESAAEYKKSVYKIIDRFIDRKIEDIKEYAENVVDDLSVDDIIYLIDSDRIDEEYKVPLVMTWVRNNPGMMVAKCLDEMVDMITSMRDKKGRKKDGED